MEIFVLITDDSTRYPQEKDAAYAKVMNVSSTHVRVTAEGHELLAGQKAYVAADQKDLEKALGKGLVMRLDSPNPGANPPKRKATSPKVRKVSVDSAVQQDSEQPIIHFFIPKTTTSNEPKKKKD